MPASPEATALGQAPVHGFRGDAPDDGPAARPRGLTVAVSREAGARGTTLARKVGELLGWQVFDQDLLDYLQMNDGEREQLLADIPASAKDWADAHLARLRQARRLEADDDTARLYRLLFAVAARGDAVLVGRAAGHLLPVESTLHVRVAAPLDTRVAYLAQTLRITRDEAAAEVLRRDAGRAEFLARTVFLDAADLSGYDLVVNPVRLGLEAAAQLVGWAVRVKQQFAELRADPTDPDAA
ncbi:MAG TPA: cytidylate kinase family protein [Urbifossiella sp.]|nr:cytidylate kinase family protein [Urbifossiella sp.]